MNNESKNLDTIIQTALQGKSEMKRIPIFDPANFEIVKTKDKNEISGFFLGRWNDYKEFYKLDQKMKGNGYMIAGTDGVMYMLPEWKSLDNKMKAVAEGEEITVIIVEITTNEKEETFVKTAVFRN